MVVMEIHFAQVHAVCLAMPDTMISFHDIMFLSVPVGIQAITCYL